MRCSGWGREEGQAGREGSAGHTTGGHPPATRQHWQVMTFGILDPFIQDSISPLVMCQGRGRHQPLVIRWQCAAACHYLGGRHFPHPQNSTSVLLLLLSQAKQTLLSYRGYSVLHISWYCVKFLPTLITSGRVQNKLNRY